MRTRNCSIALLDRYLVSQLIPHLIFATSICTMLGELIGISFEQVKFATTQGLPLNTVAQVHYFKLPAFLALALPLSVLMANIITYSKLSTKSEILALQSFGVSPYRLVYSTMGIALIVAMLMFALNEFVVPNANYQAAIALEKEWQVDRTQLAKYNKRNIIYQEFTKDEVEPKLKYLFFADSFNGKSMQNILLLRYRRGDLQEIVTAQIAQWNNSRQIWQLSNGHRDTIAGDNFYLVSKDFEGLSLKLTKNILDYANHHRDNREMSIFELYNRLKIVTHTNDRKIVRQLKINIQERYALPYSCLVFAFLGTTLGMVTGKKNQNNSLTVSAIAIFLYYAIQFFATALTSTYILPVFLGVWLPNILGLSIAIYLLKFIGTTLD